MRRTRRPDLVQQCRGGRWEGGQFINKQINAHDNFRQWWVTQRQTLILKSPNAATCWDQRVILSYSGPVCSDQWWDLGTRLPSEKTRASPGSQCVGSESVGLHSASLPHCDWSPPLIPMLYGGWPAIWLCSLPYPDTGWRLIKSGPTAWKLASAILSL